MTKIRGPQVLVGSYGEVWIEGEKVFELQGITLKVVINREDVQFGLDVDSVMTGLKGEFSIKIKKVFSRWLKYLKRYQAGEDFRPTIIAKLQDPNAKNKQIERYRVGNCWFNELPIVDYQVGAPIEEEIPGGFTPSDLVNLDQIAA